MSLPATRPDAPLPGASSTAPAFPRPFGSYLLLASFATGGMGEVYLAMHGGIAGAFRLCVLKKLRPDLTRDQEYVNRFIDEARTVVQLNHANICHTFDVGQVGEEYYLAMEYVAGVSLKSLAQRAAESSRVVPEPVALFIVAEVLAALDYAHRHRHPITGEPLHVVHRDVSPQNVLVNFEGEVKLIDFGLAQSALKKEQTETGTVMGKVAYMSPEQARGDDVDGRCDQFATAVLAYELLTGDRYYGDMPYHAIWAIAGMGNFPPRSWARVQPELAAVLGRSLSADPRRRFESCGDLKEAIGAYLAAHHPNTSERTVRTLLLEWFAQEQQQERAFISRFADVKGRDIRDAVRATQQNVVNLISGPYPASSAMPASRPNAATPASGGTKSPGSGSPGSGKKSSGPSLLVDKGTGKSTSAPKPVAVKLEVQPAAARLDEVPPPAALPSTAEDASPAKPPPASPRVGARDERTTKDAGLEPTRRDDASRSGKRSVAGLDRRTAVVAGIAVASIVIGTVLGASLFGRAPPPPEPIVVVAPSPVVDAPAPVVEAPPADPVPLPPSSTKTPRPRVERPKPTPASTAPVVAAPTPTPPPPGDAAVVRARSLVERMSSCTAPCAVQVKRAVQKNAAVVQVPGFRVTIDKCAATCGLE